MSRPESPFRNNLCDEETVKKLKAMVIKEKRINKENSKLISDLNSSLELKSNENKQLICQIQRLSDFQSSTLDEVQFYKTEKENLNKQMNDLQISIAEKCETNNLLNQHLKLLCDKLHLPNFVYNEDTLAEISIILEKKVIEESENAQNYLILEEENKMLKDKILELNQLNQKDNESLKTECDNLRSKINTFKIDFVQKFNEITNENTIKIDRLSVESHDELNEISANVLQCLKNFSQNLRSEIESKSVLQDGFDKLMVKCDDLESKIAAQIEKVVASPNRNDLSSEPIVSELEQKDEQIKRLEGLIEDNRNISRALETERDQLQNDLVDLRQRHEEKEGYLMEEYREAKQSLESYRKFNDKESADKINEIESLKILLNEYQKEINNDKSINNCQYCLEFECLMTTVKEQFNIQEENLSHRDSIKEIMDKYKNIHTLFGQKTANFQMITDNFERQYENFQQRLSGIEEKIENNIDSENKIEVLEKCVETERCEKSSEESLLEKDKLIIDLNQEIMKIDLSNKNLCEEINEFNKIINEIKNIFNSDSHDFSRIIVQCVKDSVLERVDLVKKIDQYKLKCENVQEMHDSISKENQQLMEKLSNIEGEFNKISIDYHNGLKSNNEKLQNELSITKEQLTDLNKRSLEIEHLKSNLSEENKSINQFIREIKELLHIESENFQLPIIDQIKQSIIDNESLLKKINESQLKIDKYEEQCNTLKMENENLQAKISIIEEEFNKISQDNHDSFTEQNERLQRELIVMKDEIDDLNKKIINSECLKSDFLTESKSQNQFIEEIKEIFHIVSDDFQSKIIENIKQSKIDNENLLKNMNENQFKIDNYKEQFSNVIKENEVLQQELSIIKEELNDFKKRNLEIERVKLEFLEEIKLLNQFITEIKELLFIESDDFQLPIINHIKQLIIDNENLLKNVNENQLKVEGYEEQFNTLIKENEHLQVKLSITEKQFSGNDLINLEMAEFDKTLINLNNQLAFKNNQIEDLESALKAKDNLINVFQQQIMDKDNHSGFLEERSNKMKQLLVKTKRELSEYKHELEQLKATDLTNSEQLETFRNQLEESKFLLGEALKEKEKLNEHHLMITRKMETLSKNKDQRLSDLRSQLESSMDNNKSLQREFESYKIKAQNALSTQQRPKSTFSNFMSPTLSEANLSEGIDNEELKKSISNLEVVVKELKIELQETEDKNFSLTNELDSLRLENDKWNEKYKLLLHENNDLLLKYQQIIKESEEIDKLQKNSYSNLIEKFEMEKEHLIKSYTNQLETTKLNYENKISNLEQTLLDIENEKVKYQEEIWDCREQLKNVEYKYTQANYTTENSSTLTKYQSWPNSHKSPLDQERQQGEGMEYTSELDDIDSLSNQYQSPSVGSKTRSYNTMIPLDKLINSGNDVNSVITDEQYTQMITQTQSYKKKIEHLTELLHDSEATVSRLTEQATILKSEIRRMEKNKDRESKLTDQPTHEYLKNVIMKFLDYETKLDERSQLVPVLVTLLSLDLNEKEKLTTFSKSIQFDRRQNSDGWGSYFNWTGVS